MKGLKKYSHEDRERVIDEIIPLVQEKFGANLGIELFDANLNFD